MKGRRGGGRARASGDESKSTTVCTPHLRIGIGGIGERIGESRLACGCCGGSVRHMMGMLWGVADAPHPPS